ncbi:hypothetical protein M409DRAFT_62077 [Zasmidium cellare ATCC 36951]|uniref:Heme haloperoxidase family profile domain-containing protein n=1 Tax=Zasmidium cellare ATCC 36951 TaxID=1080233 RepID=A0A6A6D865_ZASCE|nr:uncharacterized protein M409DRAFT_62077 [Zasmidium cellare ATCC 36951]KAF2173836.1 hypothetical protein M409DRAFT_62077 [Zasmidium cellare ATCC 36951]
MDGGLQARQTAPPQGAGALPAVPPPFDANLQRVSNSGANRFIAPGRNDARGPCPGLNALANHAYLPRNGVATIPQFQYATNKVFGMAPDLAAFLAVYGAVVDGTLTQWSIAGTPHIGIGGSHGNYEADSSPLRADLRQYGSNTRLIMSQFQNLYNRQPNARTANYNLEVLRSFREHRFNESIAKNPVFFYGPFAGNIVTQAAFTFIYRFMSNKSAEYPEGILNKDVLKSFIWVPGNEKIPNNWYKRHPTDEYSIPYFATDVFYVVERDPRIALIGCNQGKVNTYNAISSELLTSGAYTTAQVLANPVCFSTQFLAAALPSATGLSATVLSPLTTLLTSATGALGGCPAIPNANLSALAFCPGATAYGGPTASVFPGSIQS